jgi:hypothetical protein
MQCEGVRTGVISYLNMSTVLNFFVASYSATSWYSGAAHLTSSARIPNTTVYATGGKGQSNLTRAKNKYLGLAQCPEVNEKLFTVLNVVLLSRVVGA